MSSQREERGWQIPGGPLGFRGNVSKAEVFRRFQSQRSLYQEEKKDAGENIGKK